jgi:hypothetical protein
MEKLKRIEEAKTLPRTNTEETDLRSGDSMKGEVKRKFSPTTGGGGFTRHPAPSLTFSEEGFSAVSWTMLIWVATTIPWFL